MYIGKPGDNLPFWNVLVLTGLCVQNEINTVYEIYFYNGCFAAGIQCL